MKKPELLAPAGSFEKAKTAFMYGADAVYCGTSSLSLRSRAEVDDDDLAKTIEYAHSIGKKVHAAINIYAWDNTYEEIRKQARMLNKLKVDAIIAADGVQITENKIINNIDIKDLLTNDNGTYNNTYYQVKNELNVTEEEMNILMNSEPLNNKLKLVLDSIVKYSLRNNKEAKYSNDEMYNMIIEGINSTPNISEELKNKVIISSDRHKQDISDFLYDIEVSLKGD